MAPPSISPRWLRMAPVRFTGAASRHSGQGTPSFCDRCRLPPRASLEGQDPGIQIHPFAAKGRPGAVMNIWKRIRTWRERQELPPHLRRGELGEQAARTHLRRLGLKLLVANFRSRRGEIDLVFRDEDCLVFVEVKTRSSEDWIRPAAAVNARKRRLLSQTALDYLRLIHNPPVKIRFDIVEVLLHDGGISEVRHLPNSFPMSTPYRYG